MSIQVFAITEKVFSPIKLEILINEPEDLEGLIDQLQRENLANYPIVTRVIKALETAAADYEKNPPSAPRRAI